MSTRLQLVIDEDELEEIRAAARRERLTVSEWVRIALRRARDAPPPHDDDAFSAALTAATAHRFPAPDIAQMNAEIAEGYRRE